jgi:S1-C subfamily serine protease
VDVVLSDRKRLPVLGAVALNEEADIAILKAASPIRVEPLELAEDGLPAVGGKVYAIGTPAPKGPPLGFLANTLSDGLVSGHRERGGMKVIQTTAAISDGSSGGPLLAADGRVVGVTTWSITGGENLNFAVPASYIAMLLLWGDAEADLTRFPLVQRPLADRRPPAPARPPPAVPSQWEDEWSLEDLQNATQAGPGGPG